MRTLEQWESTARSVATGLSDGQIVVVARQAQEDEVGGMKRANVWHAMRVFRPPGQSCPCAVCVEAASAVQEVAMSDPPITDTMRRELRWIEKWGEPGDLADYGVHALAFNARERVLSALLRRKLIRDEPGGFVLTDAGRAAAGVSGVRSCLTCKHRNTEPAFATGNPCIRCGMEPDFANWEPAV